MPTDDDADDRERAQLGEDSSPVELLAALRSGGVHGQRARERLTHTRSGAPPSTRRAAVVNLLAASLRPADHAIVRWLLEQETADLREMGRGASETLYTLVAALARFGSAEDALVLWRAREATPESRTGVDVEQLARLGFDALRHTLGSAVSAGGADAREAADALAWLEEGVAAGALDDLAGYFAWADERFGLHVSGPV